MNKHCFFSSISFVRTSYKSSDSKYDLDIKPNEKWNLEGLKSVVSKRCASKIWWGVSEVRSKKNSTPSPWKRLKNTSSATFCATSAWGLRPFTLNLHFLTYFCICYLEWHWISLIRTFFLTSTFADGLCENQRPENQFLRNCIAEKRTFMWIISVKYTVDSFI